MADRQDELIATRAPAPVTAAVAAAAEAHGMSKAALIRLAVASFLLGGRR